MERANSKLILRLTATEKARFRLLASASGLNLTQFIKQRCLNCNTDDKINFIYERLKNAE
mgnify:CR=1 FL=1